MAGPTTTRRKEQGPAGNPVAGHPARRRLRRRPGPGVGGRLSAARRPGKRRLARLFLILLLVGTPVLGGVTWVVYGTSLFELRTVAVTGTHRLSADEVRAAAGVHIGGPLAEVDSSEIERRLRNFRKVSGARVVRSWPHTLRLEIVERQPAVVLRGQTGFTEVDREGVAFDSVSSRPRGIPLVELPRHVPNADELATRPFGKQRLLSSALRVAADLPDALVKETEAIEVHSFDNIAVRLSGQRTVVWGSAEEGQLKAEALLAVMRVATSAHLYDVSAPSAPATRP